MNQQNIFLDIGNTAIDMKIEGKNGTTFQKYSLEQLHPLEENLAKAHRNQPMTCYLSSVNLKASEELRSFLGKENISHFFIDSRIMEEYSRKNHYRIDNIAYLGSDLFCDIIAVENKTGLIVIDLGTATKVLYLDKDNRFQGSSILPGIRLFPKTLFQDTSLLDDYPLIPNPPLVSLKTEECISSGAILGTGYAVKGIVEELLKKAPECEIYLTGGNMDYIKDMLKFEGHEVRKNPHLVLDGIKKAFGIKVQEDERKETRK